VCRVSHRLDKLQAVTRAWHGHCSSSPLNIQWMMPTSDARLPTRQFERHGFRFGYFRPTYCPCTHPLPRRVSRTEVLDSSTMILWHPTLSRACRTCDKACKPVVGFCRRANSRCHRLREDSSSAPGSSRDARPRPFGNSDVSRDNQTYFATPFQPRRWKFWATTYCTYFEAILHA